MDKETIHEQIEILIATLKEQHDGMQEHPKYISQIDVDLFLDNIRDLYEFSIVLGKMNERDRNKIQKTHSEHANTNNLKQIKKEDMLAKNHTSNQKEKKLNKISSGVLFEDFIPHDKQVIMQKEAVMDLKTVIGINEKFVFMNELFDGSLEEYNSSIDLLNNCLTSAEAEQKIFLELQPKYHWEMNSSVVKNLLALLERRFA